MVTPFNFGTGHRFQRDPSHDSTSWAGYGVKPGNRVTSIERGYRRITPNSEEVRFLQPVFCCTQKRWWFTSDSRLASLESRAKGEQFQDANSKVHLVSDPTPRLVCDHDIKDGYFHIQIVKRHRNFLRFAFEGKAYQYCVLPFGLALAPRTFTKCMDAALAQLRHSHFELLGQFANISSIPWSGTETLRLSARSSTDPGTTNEPTKECSAALPANNIFGGRHGFLHNVGTSVSRTCPVITDLSKSVQDRTSSQTRRQK